MIKQDGNTVNLNKSIKLTPRQKLKFNSLDSESQVKYMMSMLGIGSSLGYQLRDFKNNSPMMQSYGGRFLSMQRDMTDSSSDKNHKPVINTIKNRWVGIEIECYIEDLSDDDNECCSSSSYHCDNCDGDGYLYVADGNGNEYRVECQTCDGEGEVENTCCDGPSNNVLDPLRDALRKAGVNRCSVRRDASLDESEGGVEICMLFDSSKGFKNLDKLLTVLNDMGATVNSDCGIHIHLNQFYTTYDEAMILGNKMSKFLPVVSKFFPVSRRENRFCVLQASDINRQSAINLTAFKKHGTIEYRLHTGSTNYEKLKNWIELLIHLEDHCKKNTVGNRPFTNVLSFFKKTNVPKHLVEYYTMRYNKFNEPIKENKQQAIYRVVSIDSNAITIDIDNTIIEHIRENIEQVA